MTSVIINISDEQAAALKARAAAQGLTLEAWFLEIAERESSADPAARARSAADRIFAIQERSRPDPDGWTIRDYIDHGRS